MHSIKLSFTYRCWATNAVIDNRIKRGRGCEGVYRVVGQSRADYFKKVKKNVLLLSFQHEVRFHAATYNEFDATSFSLMQYFIRDLF